MITFLLQHIQAVSFAAALLAACAPARAATETVVYSFKHKIHGNEPVSSVINLGGTLYGTTRFGGGSENCAGKYGCGTVFEVTKRGKEKVLHAFTNGSDGSYPLGALINVDGTFYGTTMSGGAGGAGTVFSITPAGTFTTVYAFQGGGDGANPWATLINVGGILYGTTSAGGGSANCHGGCGTVFSVTPAGAESVVYSFQGGSDGLYPYEALLSVGDTLYGTTQVGGGSTNCALGCGTVYSVTLAGAESVLYAFKGGKDGDLPLCSLINVGGTLYGTTGGAGANGVGTVFSVTRGGAKKTLYSFQGGADGLFPAAGLLNVGGTLYGTTTSGGTGSRGTVFSITTAGTETVLYAFNASPDGDEPEASLIDVGNTLYGTTLQGGQSRTGGTVFAVTP